MEQAFSRSAKITDSSSRDRKSLSPSILESRFPISLRYKVQFFHSSTRDDRDDSLIVATSSIGCAIAKPGVSTVSELFVIVLIADADHVGLGSLRDALFDRWSRRTTLNSRRPRLAKLTLANPNVTCTDPRNSYKCGRLMFFEFP